MKLRQRPHKSLIGIKFKFSHKHSMLFYTESYLPDSKCLTGSDGVKEWRSEGVKEWWSEIGPPLQLGKLIFSKLKMRSLALIDTNRPFKQQKYSFLDKRINYQSYCSATLAFRKFSSGKNVGTVVPRYNNPRYNDIPGITINMLGPVKRYSKMYGTEPRYNDLRYKNIPDITMGF